jgi:hypothetical protein
MRMLPRTRVIHLVMVKVVVSSRVPLMVERRFDHPTDHY